MSPPRNWPRAALIHGYTVAFWWSAASFLTGAVVALILFRNGSLTEARQVEGSHQKVVAEAARQVPADG